MNERVARIEAAFGTQVASIEELDGGMVGTVYRVDLATGRTVVAKTGETALSVEAQMLEYLGERELAVPAVLHATDELLVLSFVDGDATITPAVERDLAERLAALHEHAADAFGFPFDTLSGPLVQENPWTDSWATFYADHRVTPVLERCRDEDAIDGDLARRVSDLLDRIEDLVVEPSAPALVHGDVWTNNLITDGERVQAFLDPACYYGHPEVELAYVDWSETAGRPFFDRYDERRGIDPAFFETRRFVYRVYPLLEHLLLFGDPYDRELAATLDRIGV